MTTTELVQTPIELQALPPHYQNFVLEYLVDLNGPAALIRAGLPAGATQSATNVKAFRILRIPAVQVAISRLSQARLAKINVTGQNVIEAIAQIAFVDPRSMFDAEGNILPMKDWPEATARALSSLDVERDKDGTVVAKIRFWDKISALQMLAKHLNLLAPDDRDKGDLVIRWEGEEEPVSAPSLEQRSSG